MAGAGNENRAPVRHAWRVRAFYSCRRRVHGPFAGGARPERAAHARFIEPGSPFAISTQPLRAEFIGA